MKEQAKDPKIDEDGIELSASFYDMQAERDLDWLGDLTAILANNI